jgi:type I restriction-modification system DNA methylase subunit
VTDPTEDSINDLIAAYLRDKGIKVTSQVSAKVHLREKKPDFELSNGKIIYGEGEWNSSYLKGMTQAIEYGDIPGASGYFLLGYPESLRDRISSAKMLTTTPEKLIGETEFRGLLKLKDFPSSIFKGKLPEIKNWIEEGLQRKPKKDPDEYIRIMHDVVKELSKYLEEEPVHYQSLFENVVSSIAEKGGEENAARKAAAYLLLNQIVFYHVISKEGHVPEIDERKLKSPAQLFTEYFRQVTDTINYHAIFDFDVASIFPEKANQFIVDLVRNIKEIAPEEITRSLLGSIFHTLIPQKVRKPLAAYYTNPVAATLLANLAIDRFSSKVADLACGSGTLLVAAYNRKAELTGKNVNEEVHRRFIERELTGIDVMPFAAHLAVVQLGLKNPGYMTDKVRIGVWDSTLLKPHSIIEPLHAAMPAGQRKLADYHETNMRRLRRKQGAVSGKGEGSSFVMEKFDVILMNPPFSRKQHITKELRYELQGRFLDYKEYMIAEQNYNLYFVFLADRFLEDDGRIAMVLPATMLRQESSHGFRKLMTDRYWVDFVILNEFRSAFSEDTSFRDMLFVASKRTKQDRQRPSVFAMLKVLPSHANWVDIWGNLTKFYEGSGERIDTPLYRARSITQIDLEKNEDWYQFLPGEVSVDYSFIPEEMTPLRKVVKKVIQGFRYEKNSEFVSTRDTLISIPRERRVRIDIEVREVEGNKFIVRNPNEEEDLEIPKTATIPAIRTASWQRSIEVEQPLDFVITERFDGDKSFWTEKDVDKMLVQRREHIDTRKANLVLAGYGNIDLSSPGTFFLAFCSRIEVAPTWSFWSLPCPKYDQAVILALWLNSTFALAELLRRRTEVRGTNMKWRKKEIECFPIVDVQSMSARDIEDARKTLQSLHKMNFPCLIEQLENAYEGRLILDKYFASLLRMKITEKEIIELQRELSTRLRRMQSMMMRD